MAIAWITIALADLNNYLVGAQVAAVNTAALASGQTDRFTEVKQSVINRIRNKIESCSTNRLSATPLTIPPSLKQCACLLIIQGLQSSIPSLKLSEDQKTQIETFESDLTAIAACKLTVEEATDPLEPQLAQSGGAIELAKSTTRKATRDTLSGL